MLRPAKLRDGEIENVKVNAGRRHPCCQFAPVVSAHPFGSLLFSIHTPTACAKSVIWLTQAIASLIRARADADMAPRGEMAARGPIRTKGSGQAIGGSLDISGPAGGTDTGAAIRAAAKQLSLSARVARVSLSAAHSGKFTRTDFT